MAMFKFFCKRYEYKQLRYKSNIIPDHIFPIFEKHLPIFDCIEIEAGNTIKSFDCLP